jgi:hypothetical protein
MALMYAREKTMLKMIVNWQPRPVSCNILGDGQLRGNAGAVPEETSVYGASSRPAQNSPPDFPLIEKECAINRGVPTQPHHFIA